LTKPISALSRILLALRARKGKTAAATRKMRVITGVSERIIDVIPTERTRYTALAAVMICTASFGGFSMFFALSEVMSGARFWFVPVAMFWSLFVLSVDCWLISSSAGTRWRARASMLIPRLVVAMFIGAFIAEPLVLRVFQTAIETQVHQERQAAIDAVRTSLVACNPVPGAVTSVPAAVSCQGMVLDIPSPAAASVQQLGSLRGQASALDTTIGQENSEIRRQGDRVNSECNGAKGVGLTGILGNGPACKQDQQYLAQYKASNPVDSQKTDLATLRQRITDEQGTVSAEQTAYRSALGRAISARVAQETSPNSAIGMGERFGALGKLSLSSGFIGIASWFVRIFFVLIDCLPVLVKFISGTTPYDRLADVETASAERIFARQAGAGETAADEEISIRVHEAQVRAAARRREIDLDVQQHDAAREARKDEAVDELWRRKLAARRSAGDSSGYSPTQRAQHNGSSEASPVSLT
jgi:hypothetical protein